MKLFENCISKIEETHKIPKFDDQEDIIIEFFHSFYKGKHFVNVTINPELGAQIKNPIRRNKFVFQILKLILLIAFLVTIFLEVMFPDERTITMTGFAFSTAMGAQFVNKAQKYVTNAIVLSQDEIYSKFNGCKEIITNGKIDPQKYDECVKNIIKHENTTLHIEKDNLEKQKLAFESIEKSSTVKKQVENEIYDVNKKINDNENRLVKLDQEIKTIKDKSIKYNELLVSLVTPLLEPGKKYEKNKDYELYLVKSTSDLDKYDTYKTGISENKLALKKLEAERNQLRKYQQEFSTKDKDLKKKQK